MQKLPIFSCILLRNEGKNRPDYTVVNATGGSGASVVAYSGDFRGDPSGGKVAGPGLNSGLMSTVHVVPGGAIKPGSKLLLDYDFQPGPMGHHDYDLWAGLTDHLPWPPNTTTITMHLPPVQVSILIILT